MEVPTVDKELSHGEKLAILDTEVKVLHTPGHSPGGVCFLFDDFVFVGDTLFSGSIGRTDLPGGSYEQILDSIRTHLLVLDDNLKVLTGHGPATTIAMEQKFNPFLNGQM
jgi:glyoxylase-like metal-dependent hydrolase (beta-lactamase superfamily II)